MTAIHNGEKNEEKNKTHPNPNSLHHYTITLVHFHDS